MRLANHEPDGNLRGAPRVLARHVVLALALGAVGSTRIFAGVIGNWDFGAGSLAAAAVLPAATLTRLTDTPYYSQFGGQPDPPALVFDTSAAFGIPTLGNYVGRVMRVPDMSGRGGAAGLMASFPALANGQLPGGAAATKLNRYSVIMDILIPSSSFGGTKNYIALFQPRATKDGSWFVRKPSQNMGSTVAYSAQYSVQPDTWYRIAQVMSLDAVTSAARCEYFVNGSRVGAIVSDDIVADDTRNATLKNQDLVPDGFWSITTLADNAASLPATLSGFFLFNTPFNEYGELYVANLQFRDDALGVNDLAALGGPSGGVITVPEPGGVVGVFGIIATWFVAASCKPRDVDGTTEA